LKRQEVTEIKARIAVVPCKWHPMTAMENAARDGLKHAANATVIPVKCTGLVKVSFLLKLFARGLDGVLVLGCKEGDCHYYNGSKRCGDIVREAREVLELAGIPGKRLRFELISETQGKEYMRVLKDFIKQFKAAGERRKRVAAAGNR
jgi:coenzyme F420-reducing hydrogenase delta subunit